MAGLRVVLVGSLLVLSPAAWAICRVVVGDGFPPIVTPAQSVLFVLRHDPGDPSSCLDGGDVPDAEATDAGDDGGAGGCMPPRDLVSMVVQPKFELQQSGTRFALLMVTPRVPALDVAPRSLFRDLAVETAPLVQTQTKYVEDPSLGYQCDDPKWNGGGCGSAYSSNDSTGGCGSNYGTSGWTPPSSPPSGSVDASLPSDPQIVGNYEVAVLAGADMTAIAAWLTDHSYRYSSTDLDALSAYVDLGWTVIAVQVHGDQPVSDGALEPLSFTWEGTELRLPLGVSHQPSGGTAPLTVYVKANGRYDLPGARVSYAQWEAGAFLTRNDLEANFGAPASADPIALRVTGDPTARDTTTVTETVRIPSSQCPSANSGCGCRLAGEVRSLSGPALLAAASLLLIRRRRKR